ncbi:uncharacterized protein LOC126565382 [Anopheles maculipalpis]|uniref:uncharacterized protein LOC126565382 n=1 Tax=Anopheles maculipalpis TaxID=1496333 RepID=UPI002158DA02|nr:uncharacterized protein LOC126565382 [Anopheles maculipalpis]
MKKTATVLSSSANACEDEEDSTDEVEIVLPTSVRIIESNRSILRNPLPLLQELQRNGQLQELTIIEQRRTLPVQEGANGHQQNGEQLKHVSLAASSSSTGQKTDHISNGDSVPTQNSNVALTELLQSKSVFHHQPLSNGTTTTSRDTDKHPVAGPKATKRRTRRTMLPTDPKKALTEMSVRGLNLFRYATVNDGMYQCLECVKQGITKTFKNKYSFQRHAFLYHEGKQRKVFPCLVCNKEFCRPDKMKNHLRLVHESFEAKMEAPLPSPNMLAGQQIVVSPLHVHPAKPQIHQQHYHHQYEAEIANPNQLHEEQLRRRQQEQNVLKIRSVVNAINLRQLQQLQHHAQELRMRQTLQEQNATKPAIAARQVVEPSVSVPAQLMHLNGIGSQ